MEMLEYIINTPVGGWDSTDGTRPPVMQERIVCQDRSELSVQASRSHYCQPKDNEGPWVSCEVMIIEPPPFTKENARELDPRWDWFISEPVDLAGRVPVWFLRELIDDPPTPPEPNWLQDKVDRLIRWISGGTYVRVP